ncbi:MAG: hypothetical protein L0H47_07845 [Micrococcaceae bacterium]|nr:hypothetical protein [Micrococcaceae bacterium]
MTTASTRRVDDVAARAAKVGSIWAREWVEIAAETRKTPTAAAATGVHQ